MNARLSFVELHSPDWQRLLNWYRDVLGLQQVLCVQADRFVLLQAGEARLAIKGVDALVGDATGVLLAFEVEDVESWQDRLEQLGVALEGPIKTSHEGYRRLRLRDPEGRAVTLFAWVRSG